MEQNLLYGRPARHVSRPPWVEETGRFLIDFERAEGRGDGEVIYFTRPELDLLGRLIDRWETSVPDSEIAVIFGIRFSEARGVAEELSDKLRRICGPWPSPIKVYVDSYGWDGEALVTVWGR